MGRAMPYTDHITRTEDDRKVSPGGIEAVHNQGICQNSVISRLVEVRRKQFVTVHADWERGSRYACEGIRGIDVYITGLPTTPCKAPDAEEDQWLLERVTKPFGDVLTHF